MIVVIVFGGSINVVFYFIVIVDFVGIKFIIDDFQIVFDRIFFFVDFKFFGKYVMEDFCKIGGIFFFFKFFFREGIIDGFGVIVIGKIMKENVEVYFDFFFEQKIICFMSDFIKFIGYIQIFCGFFVFGGCVGKIIGKEGFCFEGIVKVYDYEDGFIEVFECGEIKKGEKIVVVICYEGFKGGFGMFEMFKLSFVIMGVGFGKDVVFIIDGCFFGGFYGFLIGYIVFEVMEGGFIVFVQDGDKIVIDVEQCVFNFEIFVEEFERRKSQWRVFEFKVRRGIFRKYVQLVKDVSYGCVIDV